MDNDGNLIPAFLHKDTVSVKESSGISKDVETLFIENL